MMATSQKRTGWAIAVVAILGLCIGTSCTPSDEPEVPEGAPTAVDFAPPEIEMPDLDGNAGTPAAPAATQTQAAKTSAATASTQLLVRLPDYCNTPDGMALLRSGDVILSVPNFNDDSSPAVLMKITPQNEAELFYKLPPHPETGKFGPLGITEAPSGDLYVADLQLNHPGKSRVMRIVMKDGQPADIVTVATGFTVSNAVVVKDGYLYVSETQMDTESKPAQSGVFRFRIGEEEVELTQPLADDPHLIARFDCHDAVLPLGADGMVFDADGNLYVSNFADGTIYKLEFDAEGNVKSNTIFAKAECMKSADGMDIDPKKNVIYVADSRANAVHAVALDGTVTTLAQNGDTDGTDGGMDQPCEVRLRGRELLISNMDWPVPGGINQQYDVPATIAVIQLDE